MPKVWFELLNELNKVYEKNIELKVRVINV
jgi:hypothetical protein